MTPEIENAAQVADRYVKAAKAVLTTLEDSDEWTDEQREYLQLEVEFAMQAASVYSRCAVAEAIERSFPGLVADGPVPVGLRMTLGGVDLEGDEIGKRMVEHIREHERSTGTRL